jgi:hypothetical protein
MIPLLEDVKLGGNPCPLERSIEAQAILDGHNGIVPSVEEEARRSVLSDVLRVAELLHECRIWVGA